MCILFGFHLLPLVLFPRQVLAAQDSSDNEQVTYAVLSNDSGYTEVAQLKPVVPWETNVLADNNEHEATYSVSVLKKSGTSTLTTEKSSIDGSLAVTAYLTVKYQETSDGSVLLKAVGSVENVDASARLKAGAAPSRG